MYFMYSSLKLTDTQHLKMGDNKMHVIVKLKHLKFLVRIQKKPSVA